MDRTKEWIRYQELQKLIGELQKVRDGIYKWSEDVDSREAGDWIDQLEYEAAELKDKLDNSFELK